MQVTASSQSLRQPHAQAAPSAAPPPKPPAQPRTYSPGPAPAPAPTAPHTRSPRVPRSVADNKIDDSDDLDTDAGDESGSPQDASSSVENTTLDSFAAQRRTQVVTPRTLASHALTRWGESRGIKDFDPDKSEVVALDYQPKAAGSPINVARPTQRQTLTQAVLSNWRDPNKQAAETLFGSRAFEKSPNFEPVDRLQDRSSFSWNSDGIQHFTGVYRPGGVYNADTQLPMSGGDLERVASDTSSSLQSRLQAYWGANKQDYRHLSKLAALKAGELQRNEGSLSQAGRDLVYRGAGVDPAQTWSSLTPRQIQQQGGPAAGVEVAPLGIYGYPSSDARIFHDKQDRTTDKRLLYMPGNSSPWHEFNTDASGRSEDKLRDWVVQQSKGADTREALASHFSSADRTAGNIYSGVDSALAGIAAYPGTYRAPEQGFTGGLQSWKPRDTVGTGPTATQPPIRGDVYSDLADKQEARGKQEAAMTPSNTAVGWKQGLDLATQALNYVAPLALAFPELDIPLVLDGLAQVGTGIGDVAGGTAPQQSEGLGRIAFGLLNAAPVVGGKLGRALGKEEKVGAEASEVKPPERGNDAKGDVQPDARPDADHVLRDGIDPKVSLEHQQPNANGVYTLNGRPYVQVDGHPMRIDGVNTQHGSATASVVDANGNRVSSGDLYRDEKGQWRRVGTTQGGVRDDGSQVKRPRLDPLAHKGSLPTPLSLGKHGQYDVPYPAEILESGMFHDPKKFAALPRAEQRRFALERDRIEREAQPIRDRLVKDSNEALDKFKFPTPDERPWASMPEDATDLQGFTRHAQDVSNGIVYGETHTESASKQFLIDQLRAGTYTRNNTRTLYMESFSREFDGADLADFNRTGVMNPRLASRTEWLDQLNAPTLPKQYSTTKLLEAAHDAGIDVVPLENGASGGIAQANIERQRTPLTVPNAPTIRDEAQRSFPRERTRTSNYAWAQEIEQHQAENGNKPWIALMGASHLNGSPDSPGLAVLTDALSTRIVSGAVTGVGNVSRGIPIGTDIDADFTIRMPKP